MTYPTRQTEGMEKSFRNGRRVPLWMTCQHSLDRLWVHPIVLRDLRRWFVLFKANPDVYGDGFRRMLAYTLGFARQPS